MAFVAFVAFLAGRLVKGAAPMVALLCAGVVAGCGGNQASSPSSTLAQPPLSQMPASSAPAPAGPEIVISNFSYSVPASVSPGQQITVVNKDSANHTVTADGNNLFDVRVSGGGGVSTFTAPTTPGTYPFHCKYHDNMHGSLTVQ